MPPGTQIVAAIAAGPVLWLAGAIFFDLVHWILHAMLRSRWRILRALAWPHGVHHAWIDRELRVRWENRRRNLLCHVVPEYGTQLAFSAALLLVLPGVFVAVLVALQTGVFLGIWRAGGLDRNHRPVAVLDAYRPGLHTPPAYHALHHVYPDAYYSAYTKVVDALVGGAAQIRGRRFALRGPRTAFARALAAELSRRGAATEWWEREPDASEWSRLDVLVWCDPARSPVPAVEAFARATRGRQLPPEVWAVHDRPDDRRARHYHRDVRVSYRTLVVREPAQHEPAAARAAARRALARIRRGLHGVPTGPAPRALVDGWRFARTRPSRPGAAPRVRHRAELAATS